MEFELSVVDLPRAVLHRVEKCDTGESGLSVGTVARRPRAALDASRIVPLAVSDESCLPRSSSRVRSAWPGQERGSPDRVQLPVMQPVNPLRAVGLYCVSAIGAMVRPLRKVRAYVPLGRNKAVFNLCDCVTRLVGDDLDTIQVSGQFAHPLA